MARLDRFNRLTEPLSYAPARRQLYMVGPEGQAGKQQEVLRPGGNLRYGIHLGRCRGCQKLHIGDI